MSIPLCVLATSSARSRSGTRLRGVSSTFAWTISLGISHPKSARQLQKTPCSRQGLFFSHFLSSLPCSPHSLQIAATFWVHHNGAIAALNEHEKRYPLRRFAPSKGTFKKETGPGRTARQFFERAFEMRLDPDHLTPNPHATAASRRYFKDGGAQCQLEPKELQVSMPGWRRLSAFFLLTIRAGVRGSGPATGL